MITLTEQTNGSLKISLDKGQKKELKKFISQAKENEINEDYLIVDLLDKSGYLGSGWDAPNNIPLTDAPIITYGAIYDSEEQDEPIDYEKVWYYSDYAINSFMAILLRDGEAFFNRA